MLETFVRETDGLVDLHVDGEVISTTAEHPFWVIADRHSEHVACAGGAPVLAAGEIFFSYDNQKLEVIEISNQSTGYCPEPECWQFVAKALERIPLGHPEK